jgi:putative ABC transport system ATP-binding protein
MSKYQIECISLCKKYTRNKQIVNAVDNINLCISTNEIVIIKGRSGAGKSTLLNLMCGLIKPTHGKVMIENNSINEVSNHVLSRLLLNQVGIIFQSFNLLPTYSVFENIEIGIIPKRLKQRIDKENIISLLERFNLKDNIYSLPSELSAGQQQKVAIIRTLVKEPSIIFADEPTGSVDDETAGEILESLLNLQRDKQVTLVLATHGNIIEQYADNVFTIENGRIKN